ncbi:hypothetical protein L249_4377 [Ophiocordyceps polyrhachis-furcata BCC 54312]|uniref:BIR-domain-containing protein n=1 Tax=Ophiocordyceps polyrhachis-furcata BCC 54312 TaxID=1330021 RepID=A0A367L7F3_9HYPO|nr:hypothetical protein L249_4377 [Ophiocordyceps polyrhachis-furcata BCC 54312]
MDSAKLQQYVVCEARLASFQKIVKKRGSSAGGRAKTSNTWPHKQIAPASLAKAGFFFDPTPASPDNVVCFLCAKPLDGWEAGDDPLLEHLKHAPDCGWATVAAIEADVGDYGTQDPISSQMIEARKATFGDWWPHDGKKGWKCKTKQLADAGWKYTPTADSDDMATCAYCQLALDGWEPGDKPYEEHFNRSPNCAFFHLINQFGGAKKRAPRGRAARGSKASRMSAQSTASERLSTSDTTATADDSLLTTASTMTQGGKKVKGKKATAFSKTSRSKAKKNDVDESEVVDDEPTMPRPKPAKAARGRKRGSDAVEESNASILAPSKKRATRTRRSTVTDTSTVVADDSELVEPTHKTANRRGIQTSQSEASRQASAVSLVSSASFASLRAPTEQFPDDDEIERQLEADLERDWDSDEEQDHLGPKDVASADYIMLDPHPVETDDDAVEEELRTLQAEMRVDEPEQQLHVPKKGRKAGVRKASSKQNKPSNRVKAAAAAAAASSVEEPRPQEEEETHDVSVGSTDTVVKKAASESKSKKKGRGEKLPPGSRSSDAEEAPSRPSQSRQSQETRTSVEIVSEAGNGASPEDDQPAEDGEVEQLQVEEARATEPLADMNPSSGGVTVLQQTTHQPSTPVISPAPSARQPALSPSPSPQSSDAENRPPSSKPATSSGKGAGTTTTTVPLNQTPGSPSKRNMLVGLQTSEPWTAASLDLLAILEGMTPPPRNEGSDDKENPRAFHLSTPEKAMTVEEWIYFNAGQAEARLKHECEVMVSRFEREGTRAIRALEGLSVE